MAIIISNGATTLNTASGFYRVEAANLSITAGYLSVATATRYENITFSNAGNCLGTVLFLAATSMTNRQLIVSLEEYQTVTSFNTTTERVNKTAHGLNDGDIVSFTSTGTLPTGITSGTQYYVVNKTADDFQISLTLGGSAVLLSGTPSGTATVGVQRATKTTESIDITGDGMTGAYANRGMFFTPITFTSGYAVDTTAGKWRIRVGHGTGTGTWLLGTSNGTTNFFYGVWCDNVVSFTDGDVLIVKDEVIIDKTATLGAVLGIGDTVKGTSIVVCSNPANPLPEDVALLKWEESPASSYTLSVPGAILLLYWSGFRVGSATNRIPIAQKAIISFIPPVAGTSQGGIFCPPYSSTYQYGGASSLFFYGEIPTYQYTTLASDAATGQATLTTTDSVDWVAGDKIVIGKQDASSQGDLTIYTISTVVGNTITLTTNIATNNRKAGATVMKLDCHGVKIENPNVASRLEPFTAANIQYSGVDLYNIYFTTVVTTYYHYLNFVKPEYVSQWLFEDITNWTNSTTSYYMITMVVPPSGILMQRVYSFRAGLGLNSVAYYTSLHKSGRFTAKDCRVVSQYGGGISSASNIRLTVENCVFENSRNSAASGAFFNITGIDGVFTNNYCWGNANTNSTDGGATRILNAVNAVVNGNVYNKNICALMFGTSVTIGCEDTNSTFGDEEANTTDIAFMTGAFIDYTFNSHNGNLTIDETLLVEAIEGSKVSFVDANNVATNDNVLFSFGKTQRTNSSLSDTNVHTAGGSALRFESIDPINSFDFHFDVPTGDIQDKDMMVGIWCKINSEDYWFGDYDMPRLTVTYDGSTEVYAEAAQTTEWQFLFAPFRPTTASGKITLSLSCRTDALDSDRYVYFDDISILYPAGYKLDLGKMDIWDNALPVLPPISTVASALDVWAADPTQFGANTVGDKVNKIKKIVTGLQ